MIDAVAFRQELISDEGRKTGLYECSQGHATIGVGHNTEAKPLPPAIAAYLAQHGCITDAMVDELLDQDIADVLRELYQRMPWAAKLNEPRQRVLASMLFNMGWGDGKHGLSSFKNTLKAIELGRFWAAAHGMQKSKWAGQVGDRAKRLAKAMESGTF